MAPRVRGVWQRDALFALAGAFCRAHELEEHAGGKNQIVLETESYYDDRSIRWSRITAHLLENPGNGHIESIIYGVDISSERVYVAALEREKQRRSCETSNLAGDGAARAAGSIGDMQEIWDLYAQADRDRRHDYLTGLSSRLDLYDALKRSENGTDAPVTAVFMVDLDDFKDINDAFGHTGGDTCLSAVGDLLNRFGSTHDMSFFRFGGDEIVGIAHEDVRRIPQLATCLLDAIRELPICLGVTAPLHLSASIGYTTTVHGYQEAIDAADRAMYAAKRRGKDQVACID